MQALSSLDALKDFCFTDRPLAQLTTWGVGGVTKCLIAPRDKHELAAAVKTLSNEGEDWQTLGGGSNVLICDGVVNIPLIHTARLDNVTVMAKPEGIFIDCGSGVPLKNIFALALRKGWSGVEPLAGIPGTVGGALIGNAGTLGGSVSDAIYRVSMIESDGSETEKNASDIEWGYRSSSLASDKNVVSGAIFRLERSTKEKVLEKSKVAVEERKSQPIMAKTAGCIFKNPPGYSAGKLLDDAGCKGITVGGVKVSERHANFFENFADCSARDIVELAKLCIKKVEDMFGVTLKFEIKTIGFEDEPFTS